MAIDQDLTQDTDRTPWVRNGRPAGFRLADRPFLNELRHNKTGKLLQRVLREGLTVG